MTITKHEGTPQIYLLFCQSKKIRISEKKSYLNVKFLHAKLTSEECMLTAYWKYMNEKHVESKLLILLQKPDEKKERDCISFIPIFFTTTRLTTIQKKSGI